MVLQTPKMKAIRDDMFNQVLAHTRKQEWLRRRETARHHMLSVFWAAGAGWASRGPELTTDAGQHGGHTTRRV